MFTPQIITCECCGYQGHIITEDIPYKHIKYGWNDELVIDACCPSCQHVFELYFVEEILCNKDIRYKCVSYGNTSLTMWRRKDIGKAQPPVFRPVTANRTVFEQQLDVEGQRIVDGIYKWMNKPQPRQTLEDILGLVVDYTKTQTWKKFKKNHFVMSLCAHDGKQDHYIGFNGKFNTVNKQNHVLLDGFELYLHGKAEEYSNQFCYNKIGRCAEVHAANSCLNKEPDQSLNDLRFSVAYICRFAIPRSYCLNCVTLFQTVRNG